MTDLALLDRQLKELMGSILGIPASELDDNSSPRTISFWDSLTMLRIIIEVEKRFEVKLNQTDLLQFSSLGKIRLVIERLTASEKGQR